MYFPLYLLKPFKSFPGEDLLVSGKLSIRDVILLRDFSVREDYNKKKIDVFVVPSFRKDLKKYIEKQDNKEIYFFVQYQTEIFIFKKVKKEDVELITEGDRKNYTKLSVGFENSYSGEIMRE